MRPEERYIYDDFVRQSPFGHVLQSYEWGEVKERTGWRARAFLALRDGTAGPSGAAGPGRAVAGAMVLSRAIPGFGGSVLYCPRGPVLDWGDREAATALLAAIRALAQDEGGLMLKIDPALPPTGDLRQSLARYGFRRAAAGKNFEGVQPRFVYRLEIDRPLDAVMASFAAKTRYNIRLAEKKGVRVRQAERDDLPTFYVVLAETARRDHFLIRDFGYFQSLWDCLVERGLGRFYLAEYGGEVIAGTFAMRFGDKTWYLYGASANRHRDKMPNYALQWAMIQWAHASGCKIYDFRGVGGDLSPDNPLYGLHRFKKGFSGRLVEFAGEYDLVYRPAAYHFWRYGLPLYRRVRGLLLRRGRAGANGVGEADTGETSRGGCGAGAGEAPPPAPHPPEA